MKPIFIITLFESYFSGLFNTGVVGQALRGERGKVPPIKFINPSDYNEKGFKGVDSSPYGGGAGQVMRGDVLENCLLKGLDCRDNIALKAGYEVIYLGPRGSVFNQQKARELNGEYLTPSSEKSLVFVCGRYEGIDERFLAKYVDQSISLGDFVLSGGEVALASILDCLLRLSPNVLKNEDSAIDESFEDGLLEYPQYAKPQLCCDQKVPEVLLSGNHKEIRDWRAMQKEEMTRKLRPDLYQAHLNRKK